MSKSLSLAIRLLPQTLATYYSKVTVDQGLHLALHVLVSRQLQVARVDAEERYLVLVPSSL